jgi:3-oxoacyl-[acyl-carrier-protein] synthase II
VVTGIGIITGYGTGWEINAEGFRWGRSAFKPVTIFDTGKQRVKTAAQVEFTAPFPKTRLSVHQIGRIERAGRLLFYAADEALSQAAWNSESKTPVILGTTSGGMSKGEDFYRTAIQTPVRKRSQATRVTHYLAQRQAMNLCQAYNLSGPIQIVANACAAGANAVGHGWEIVRSGLTERALVGGYDALSHLVFTGFGTLQALSPTSCRPFDANRDGLALGEGAAVLALESLASAEHRRAPVLGEIIGYGASTDSHHLTQPHPQGEAALKSMNFACQVAGVQPDQVSYINAHGTGTPLNDSAEAAAINAWAGDAVGQIYVSSTKAGIGHLLGAAGAVESAICIMALKEQWLPPMMSTQHPDPLVRFPMVQKPMKAKDLSRSFEFALSNSFGFGGANASLIFRRWT